MSYDSSYFIQSEPNILENVNLRNIQLEAYVEICNHFLIEKSKEHAVAILPTGSGKTGVMALAPYGISNGRVLIITPQLVIKDHVMESLDPSTPDNFWLKYRIFDDYSDLPKVVEYDKETFNDELKESNIVILNIHKLSAQSRNSLLSRVDKDFFDLIIIDEAHHSPAETWQNALQYFDKAKVLKLTGTPFRTDRKKIEGHVVINYRLGKAMQDGIVKTLKNFVLLPEKIFLTVDGKNDKQYSLKEFELLGIRDKDYISRSVALSPECNKQIVDASIEELSSRKEKSDVPHKIIGVCCSIEHAEQVKTLYEVKGLRAVIVHSKQPNGGKIESLRKIESHQADVVIHVAMLGEGYDHPYLSVAAIFRPYRSLAPYSQFIGRILRKIPDNEVKNPLDNIGVVVAHRDLDLNPLWKEYMEEKKLCDVLDSIKRAEPREKRLIHGFTKNLEIGDVSVEGNVYSEEEYYEYTQSAVDYQEYEKEINIKVQKLKDVFPEKTEKELDKIARKETAVIEVNPLLKNPKKYRFQLRHDLAQKISFDIPGEIIVEFGLIKEENNLKNLPVRPEHRWVLTKGDNAAIISKYLNDVLMKKFGERNKWTILDYQNANKSLDGIVSHLKTLIKSILK